MRERPRTPESERELIKKAGHRNFVGGQWNRIGRLQFDFLVSQGLEPQHVFLDVACGALRGGKHFIEYLEPGNYLGIDLHQELLDAGAEEVGAEMMESRKPELLASSDFEFERFGKRPEYALALSLYTHLNPDDIRKCLRKLRAVAVDGCDFWASFRVGDSSNNPAESGSKLPFRYAPDELAAFGAEYGWEPHHHGEWGHPRGQQMMRFRAVGEPPEPRA